MVRELQKHVEANNVLFGVRETLKHAGKLSVAYVAQDCRESIKNLLKEKKITYEEVDYSKEDITTTLGLQFHCEVFGVKK